ncbi:putative dTDP-4-dehydrorhamnose reductase [uncultured Defluviicoccus sp.]|uniref:Putative dTDP-4-dehydrorhamnose reductase n=1 Tax=metagenome TaxID=256318 RepID=A0A380TC27_9ZZZZ|nr:putative dTDP-4-dehydrorhamnose reductase [uncultured Defluviicoccus sp.]
MRIFVAGAAGQVARALEESATATGRTLATFGRPGFDLTDSALVRTSLSAFAPDLVINAAAWTAVDRAETERDAAWALNATGPGQLSELCHGRRIPIIHLSTDYVFAGDKPEPYVETDPVAPSGVYAESKLAGERAVAAANPRHLILRTAWVHSAVGANFPKTMIRLAETRDEVGVVADQQGSPTYAPDIAGALLAVADRIGSDPTGADWGVYHLTSSGSCVWASFAERVFARTAPIGMPSARVRRITTAEFPTPVRRPANSRLDCSKLASRFGVTLPPWESGVDRCVERLAAERGMQL